MAINIDVNQAMMLLGAKTLELEQLRGQCETLANDFNQLKEENEALKLKVAELEAFPALKEVGRG